jgi:hypothetical protein
MRTRKHPPVPRQWGVDVAVGSAVFAVGAGGILALVVAAGLAEGSVWCENWCWVAAIPFGLLTTAGLYMLAAVYFPLPLPQTRASREAKAQMTIGPVREAYHALGFAVVEVPLRIGHLDIVNASMNVRVPDSVRITRTWSRWGMDVVENGHMAHSAESLDGEHGLNYWTEDQMQFSAFTSRVMFFRLDSGSLRDEFPFEFRLYASALQGGVWADARFVPKQPDDDA